MFEICLWKRSATKYLFVLSPRRKRDLIVFRENITNNIMWRKEKMFGKEY